jgi:flagellar M-ring protein FliF
VPNFDQLLSRLTELRSQLSVRQQVSLVATFLVAVGLVAGASWWVSRPDYALLFDDMDPSAAAEVIAKLDAQKIAYKLDAGGRGIRVPSTQVDRLRLDLSAEGLPSSGRIGFEIFDRTAFGQTEFLEHVNYRRALEGEIARTIATISEVEGARVHIAMAKESLFGAREQPAKASVILKLRNANRPLAAATVSGITNLVAASVEGLRPDAVVLMDSFGRPLSRPSADDDNTPLGAGQLERQQRIEHEMVQRVVALLEPVVGANRVRANVTVRLSPSSEEATEEKWDPTTAVIRSRQMTSDISPTSAVGPAVSGARANLPPPATPAGVPPSPPPPTPTTAAATRSTETTNYEISKTTRHTVKPSGDIARLSVAVILDDDVVTTKDKDGKPAQKAQPRKREELQKLQALVATAVGMDQTRGDQVTVENIAFDVPVTEEPAPPTFIEKYAPVAGEGAKTVGVIALVGALLMFVIRPALKQALGGQIGIGKAALATGVAGGPAALPRTVQDLEGEIEAQLNAIAQQKQLETIKMPVLTKKANLIIQNDSEGAAKLLRAWLADEEH